MTSYFQKEGRDLLSNGYLIVPIKPGDKAPALRGWQTSRIGIGDIQDYKGHGVGVLCGQGAYPICAIDIDTTNAELAERFVNWCRQHLGSTCERIGKAPKILLPYRAADSGWGKTFSSAFSTKWCVGPNGRQFSEGWKEITKNGKPHLTSTGQIHRVEVLGKGQQFVAYHIHPDTSLPYEWVDLFGGIEYIQASELPVLNQEQIVSAMREFDRLAAEMGLQCLPNSAGGKSRVPKAHEQPDDEDYYGRVNQAALERLDTWVPQLFPSAKAYNEGYRVESVDLGRDLEEAIGIQPMGIVDFGVADMGDPRQGCRTPIDLVLEWGVHMFEDALDAPLTPFEAAQWLCDCMETPKEELGFGLKRKREKAAERNLKRMALKAFKETIAACDDSIDLLGDVGKKARGVLAGTPELWGEVADILSKRYKEITGTRLPIGELRKVLIEPPKPTVRTKRPLTEFGNAERMLDKYGKGLMYVPELKAWHIWTGVYWRRAPDIEIEHYAKQTVRSLIAEAEDHKDDSAEFFKFCAISQQAKMVKNIVTLAASDPQVAVPVDELDKNTRYLGAKNGVIDILTGELLPPDPSLRITKIVACEYHPEAHAPLWENVLKDVLIDDELIEFMHRVIGYSLMGEPNEDVLLIPYGCGSNGKSTVLGTVQKVMGGYARASSSDTFVSDGRAGGGAAGGAREDLVRLRGSRFVYVNEPDEGCELREGSVKAMTGGDTLNARAPYGKESIEITPTWVACMPTNHKPIIKGTDNGIWRRILLIPFLRNFENDPNKDPDMNKKLLAEYEGILAWMVRGAKRYQEIRLKKAGVVKEAAEQYRSDMDLLSEWLEECCDIGHDYSARSAELWNSWSEYAKHRGLLRYISNQNILGRRLDTRFPSRKMPGGVRIRTGLRLRCDFDLF